MFNQVRHIIDMPLKKGVGTFKWELADPNLLLVLLLGKCPELAAAFGAAANVKEPTFDNPWSLIVGFDEYIPGNKLSYKNRRKCMNLSYTFAELGRRVVSRSAAWITPVSVRATMIKSVAGEWSAMLCCYLRLHLLGPAGISTAGIAVNICGQPLLIHAKLKVLLTDGDGHRMALDWRGSAALKPCFKHFNVWKRGSDLANRQAGHVEITCDDHCRLKRTTASHIADDVEVLSEAHRRVELEHTDPHHMTKASFEELMQVVGLNFNPVGLLWARDLMQAFDVGKAVTYDWVHTTMQDGTLSKEVFLFISQLESQHLTSFPAIEAYLKHGWMFPNCLTTKSLPLHRIFDSYRSRSSHEAEKLKASASEILGVYSLIRHYIEREIVHDDSLLVHRESFDACCKVVDIIQTAKRGHLSMPDAGRLMKIYHREHMVKHKRAYGEDHIVPKHHWMWDVCDQFCEASDEDLVFDAFVIERNHLGVKAVAEHIDNTASMERSVLSSYVTAQIRELNAAGALHEPLIGRITNASGGIKVARSCNHDLIVVTVGDFVFRGMEVGKVLGCVSGVAIGTQVIVDMLEKLTGLTRHSSRYRLHEDDRRAWRVADLAHAGAWYLDAGTWVVLSAFDM